MAMKDTFLELSPEHGGLRFGPFVGMEIRLGSLPAPRNDVTLPEDLGILPEHVKIISQGDGSFLVAPVERAAVVFVWRSGSAPKQITTPYAIQSADEIHSADAFSLGSIEGPKFFVLRVERPKPKPSEDNAFNRAKSRLTGKSMLDEIKRQGMASVLTTKGGAFFQYYWTFVRTGTIFQPRYIIMFFLIGMGWITTVVTGLFSCSLGASNMDLSGQLASKDEQLRRCNGVNESEQRSFHTEVARLLSGQGGMVNTTRKRNWQDTLGARDKLTIAFKTEFAQIYGDTEGTYRRFYRSEEGGQAIKALRKKFKRMLGGEVDASRHLAFIAATDQNVMQRDWRVENDSLAQQVCTRGPARMTWRQAVNLNLNGGISPVNALVPSDEFEDAISGDAKACKVLSNAVRSLVDSDADGYKERCLSEQTWAKTPGVTNNLNNYCFFTNEPDARSVFSWTEDGETSTENPNWDALAKSLMTIWTTGKRFPKIGNVNDVTSRLLYFYAADAQSKEAFQKLENTFKSHEKEIRYTGLMKLPGIEATGEWAINRAARVLALSAAVPCLAVKDNRRSPDRYKIDELAENMGLDKEEMPDFIDCITVNALASEP